ncbi:N-acetyltransferase [Ktedonosporobacter rubrisoli]|uniref:N-acetyltransferase n=1 Tax=Ktedonosporobacter rubrisoli TaxID=2509675 RepID=A0A4P6JYF4_KTERU|nr:N-acetyltransferase [Ktedonosporobacter rubrisoli]QBD80757.1 N-acetyltransferase [Ktedonosporobacter rubrisoli]
MTTIKIRPERVTDYSQIGNLHAQAFGNRAGEPAIVALLRQRRAFDPALSLLAEIDGQVVGHVLFSPYQMSLGGQLVPAVNLAPIAVSPAYQGQGIGGQLIREGHRLAAAKGYIVSVLIGHPTYYPRFGYQMHAFGLARLELSLTADKGEPLTVRPPQQADVAALCALWQREEADVDMVFAPEPDLLAWLSPDPAVRALVFLRADQVVGYTRVHSAEPTNPRIFLARDAETAHAMLASIAHQFGGQEPGTIYTLPLHPASALAPALGQATVSSESWAMACSLVPGPLEDYMAGVREGKRLLGRALWPVAFDLA